MFMSYYPNLHSCFDERHNLLYRLAVGWLNPRHPFPTGYVLAHNYCRPDEQGLAHELQAWKAMHEAALPARIEAYSQGLIAW
jgi:hypothetical protein